MTAIFGAGMQLIQLMNELAEERRAEPDRRPHLGARPQRPRRGHARRPTRSPRSSSSSPWPATTPPAPRSATAWTCCTRTPTSGSIWQDDLEGVTPTAVEEIVRVASPVTFMRRTATTDTDASATTSSPRATRSCCSTAPPTATRGCSTTPSASTCAATPTTTSASAGPGPHFCLGAHLARREVTVAFRQLLTRLPDIEVAGAPGAARGHGHPARRRHQAPPGPLHPDGEGRLLSRTRT